MDAYKMLSEKARWELHKNAMYRLEQILEATAHKTTVECPRGVMAKTNCSKRVRTPVVLLHSLSDKYPWKRYEPPYALSYELNSSTIGLLEE